MLNKKINTKKLGVIIVAIYIMILTFGIVCYQRMTLTAKAEINTTAINLGMSQEQEDEYYRNMGYEPVRKLGDLFKEYTIEQKENIKEMVLLNDIDCSTDTSWHDFVDNWQETGYKAPSFDFEFNGMGHKILNGENLLNINSFADKIRKTTVLLGQVKGVKNLYLENIAVAVSPREYLLNVHVRSVNDKNIVNKYGLSEYAPKFINNCSVEGAIEYNAEEQNTWTSIGGLVSYVEKINNIETVIENSYFYGNIICDAKKSGSSIGGLIGVANKTGGKLKRCFAYYGLDLINGDNARVGLITGSQWIQSGAGYLEYTYEYETVYAGNSGEIAEVGAKIEGEIISDKIKDRNCDIEEIETVPAALLGDKDTVSELDFDKVWNLGEKDKHPTLRTLSVTVADNTVMKDKDITENYNYSCTDQYFNEGDKFELSFEITDVSIGYVYFEIDGKDSPEKVSENKLTIDVEKNTFIAFQMGYRPSISIKNTVDKKDPDYYGIPDRMAVVIDNAIYDGVYYALGDKVKIKITVEDGYHIGNIVLPKEAVEIGENEYEIAVGKIASTRAEKMSYTIEVDIEKDFPMVGVIIGVVAGVVVLAVIALIIVFSKKKKQKKTA